MEGVALRVRIHPSVRVAICRRVVERDQADRVERHERCVTGGAFPRKIGGENRLVAASRRPWWPSMARRQALSTRAFGPRLRRLTALTGLATRAPFATKSSTARCG